MPQLTDSECRAAKPTGKPAKLWDGEGLYLLVSVASKRLPRGSRLWRLRYWHEGRESTLSLGKYPRITLAEARSRAEAIRNDLAHGINPSVKRQEAKAARGNTFQLIALEWLALQTDLAAKTISKVKGIFAMLFREIGRRPIAKLGPVDVLKALKVIEARGTHETAHRARQRCSQVFRYAVQTERAERDVTVDLRDALKPVVTTNHPAIVEPAKIGELLRAIDGYTGSTATACALQLAPLLFVRPGELRHAEWAEFDLDAAEPIWRIPGPKMKMGDAHIVPLAAQALEILRKLQLVTGEGKYLFPSLRSSHRPMSDNTINAALRRMGYDADTMTGHGFRTVASTSLNELGFHPDLIELQLAHRERNQVRAAYNKAQRLPERRKMMTAWADYLDTLRDGGRVIPIKRRAK